MDMNKQNQSLRNIILATIIFLLMSSTCNQTKDTIAAPEDLTENADRYWNDLARYLAGLKPLKNSSISKLDSGDLAKQHQKFFKKSWDTESRRLAAMKKWRDVQLKKESASTRTVFYPFSGPDFINIYTLFPNGKRYILFGLEKPGSPPDVTSLNKKQQKAFLAHVQKSLASILRWSFFRTLSMKRDFDNKSLDGLNPILLAFMARMGNRILDVTTVRIASDAALYGIYSDSPFVPRDRALPEFKNKKSKFKAIPGIRIRFIKENSRQVQELIFLSFNVSDSGMKSFGQFPGFVKVHCPCNTYIKAASYLMHNSNFSVIRNLVLSESDFILEDDSGIPLKYFNRKKWNLTFYGRYHTPIPLFKNRVQQDLRNAYRKNGARPLPFGIGYNWAKGTSNLLAARKKK